MTRPSRRGRNRALLTGETGTRTPSGDDVSYDAGPYTPPGATSIPSGTYRLAADGGEEVVQSHGSMGSTETIDLANGNYHAGTLTANCTFTFSGATNGVLCDFILELTQDGTGGWTSTFPGSVADGAALASALDTTLSTTSLLVFVTRDGGTTWYGYLAGAASGGATYGTPANTYGTPAAGAASTGVRTDATLPGPPIVILTLTNKSGGSVAAGDVVVIDTGNDTAFTTTTTGQAEVSVGIAQATIASNASGAVLVAGLAALVNVPSSMTRGRYLETHTVVKQATGSATRRAGSFGQFLIAGTTPTAWLWGQTDQTASGGGASFATPAIVLGTAAAAGAASTVIRSDSTIVAFDATSPTTQAFGDSAATGSAAIAARRDHKHAWPTAAVTTSGLTQATARLLGRTTASTGAIEEITVGTGLSLSAGSLTATGGGGGLAKTFVGYNTAGGSNQAMTASRVYCKKVSLTAGDLVVSISAYVRNSTDALNGHFATVLDDNSNAPGKLLAFGGYGANQIYLSTSSSMPSAYRWLHVAVGFTAPSTADYWITWSVNGGAGMDIAYDGSGSDQYFTASGNYATSAYPTAWAITTSTQKFSIRALVIA